MELPHARAEALSLGLEELAQGWVVRKPCAGEGGGVEGLYPLDLIFERHGVLSPRGEELRPGCGLAFLRLAVRARDGGERGPESPGRAQNCKALD